jgi:acetyltransferase-like isoleucine patch superfamily enzyme
MELKEILQEKIFASDKELSNLLYNIYKLRSALRSLTKKKFKRINPFIESIFDWKEKGAFLFGKEKNITVYDSCTIVGDVSVGENTWIGPYSAIDGTAGIRIGKNCSISSGVQILTHDTIKWALTGGKHPYEYAPVEIGDNCFLGTNAVILKGVKIGHHCIIGAGAIVTSDVPDYHIATGVPARIKAKIIIKDSSVSYKAIKK